MTGNTSCSPSNLMNISKFNDTQKSIIQQFPNRIVLINFLPTKMINNNIEVK